MTIYDFLVRVFGGHRSLPAIGWQQFNNALDYRQLDYNTQVAFEEFFDRIVALPSTWPTDIIDLIVDFSWDNPVRQFIYIFNIPSLSRTWTRDQFSASPLRIGSVENGVISARSKDITTAGYNFNLNNVAKGIKVLTLGTIGTKIVLDCAHCWYEQSPTNVANLGADISLAISIGLKGMSKFTVGAGLFTFALQWHTAGYETAVTGLVLNLAATSAYAIGGLYLAFPVATLIAGVEIYNLYQNWSELQNIRSIRNIIEQGNVEDIKTIIQQPNFMELRGKHLPEEYLLSLYSIDSVWFKEQIKYYVKMICSSTNFQTALLLSYVANKGGEKSWFFHLIVDSLNSGCFVAQQFAFKIVHFLSSEEQAKLTSAVPIETIKNYIEQSSIYTSCGTAIDIFKESLFKDEHVSWLQKQMNSQSSFCVSRTFSIAKNVLSPSSKAFLVIREAYVKQSIEDIMKPVPQNFHTHPSFTEERLRHTKQMLDDNVDVLVKPENCAWLNQFNSLNSGSFNRYATQKFHEGNVDCAGVEAKKSDYPIPLVKM